MHPKEKTLLHFVGIGGIGMSGIAEVFLNQGYQVTGSDLSESDTTKRLASLGAQIHVGHRTENVKNAHVVVVSSAVSKTNPEVLEAKRRRIPVIPRAEMLGELMRGKVGIAVAGTHGKTTTTSMLATVLTIAGLDPTLVIGGKVDSFGGNAKLGQGKFVVAEADESDGSFLHLPATYGVITNIDNDHLDHFGSLEAIEKAFGDFIGKLPFYGIAAVCGDDPGVKRCLESWTKPFLTYGLSETCDLYAKDIKCQGMGSVFQVYWGKNPDKQPQLLGSVKLLVPGKHNVLNALAAIAISNHLGVPFTTIADSLAEFRGVKRRFDVRWQDPQKRRVIVDDYGHHPTEITSTLSAAKNYWPGRIVSVFQPHRFSRTQHCMEAFLGAFKQSDVVLVTDIYAAGEEPIAGVDSSTLAAAMRKVALPHQEIIYTGDLTATAKQASELFRDGDMVLCLGAGSITKLPDELISLLGL